VQIKKERTVEVTIEEGWYSEQEMVSELHWNKNLGSKLCFRAVNMSVWVITIMMGCKIHIPPNAQEKNPGSNCCVRENAFLRKARFYSPSNIIQRMLVCKWFGFIILGFLLEAQ